MSPRVSSVVVCVVAAADDVKNFGGDLVVQAQLSNCSNSSGQTDLGSGLEQCRVRFRFCVPQLQEAQLPQGSIVAHSNVLHDSESCALPKQDGPLQLRERCFCPPPHETLHEDQLDQEFQRDGAGVGHA